MFIVLKRRTLLFFGLALSCFALAAALPFSADLPVFRASGGREAGAVYVLDAGHGGEDGGAVSPDGVKESGINLSIVRRLDALLRFLGQETVLTRTDDVSIYSPEAKTLREKKASDLKNRVALANRTPGAVLVSIHQNSLPSAPGVHGAQVFFGSVARSDALAASVQAALDRSVNIGNEKQEKKIDPSIYLMKNVTCPAILVECGFLSNAAECARLREPDHQTTLAVAVAAGILNTDRNATERETEREVP